MAHILKAVAAAAAIFGAVSVAAPANAAPVTVSGSCSTLGFSSGISGNIVCDKFDTTAYSPFISLVSMTLQITGEIQGTLTLTNGPAAAVGMIGTTTNKFFLSSSLAGFTLPVFGTEMFSTNYSTPLTNLAADTNSAFPVSGSNGTAVQTNNSNLAGYQQNSPGGTFNIPILTGSGASFIAIDAPEGGSTQSMQQRASALLSFTYDDGTVTTPEPATIAVLGAGMLALGAFRRRRRA